MPQGRGRERLSLHNPLSATSFHKASRNSTPVASRHRARHESFDSGNLTALSHGLAMNCCNSNGLFAVLSRHPVANWQNLSYGWATLKTQVLTIVAVVHNLQHAETNALGSHQEFAQLGHDFLQRNRGADQGQHRQEGRAGQDHQRLRVPGHQPHLFRMFIRGRDVGERLHIRRSEQWFLVLFLRLLDPLFIKLTIITSGQSTEFQQPRKATAGQPHAIRQQRQVQHDQRR